MKNSLKIKDFVLIALLSALYLAIYMVSTIIISFMGPFGHAISPGICALFAGTLFYFMSRKLGKMWQFTILIGITMAIFTIMGAGYLPWLISSMTGAVLADIIASRSDRPSAHQLALASGLIHVGSALGAIIPSMFFVEKYRAEWIERGQSPEAMDAMISATQGTMGILATAVTFVLAVVGVYLGYFILRKHFRED